MKKADGKGKQDDSKAFEPVDCDDKVNWVCQGTLTNPEAGTAVATNDLKADEGGFCLWHVHEPVDVLPNDEGKNFDNTDLACNLQVSSRDKVRCAYNPDKDTKGDPNVDKKEQRNGLEKRRGDRHNAASYPVLGSTIGWTGSKTNQTFLELKNHDDRFHCHYSPSNTGLLRIFAMQHMGERSYPGAMKQLCGCGYKHLAKLVSRCDCTRSGRNDNNCAKWHKAQLVHVTNTEAPGHPVRCNNCNKDDPV
jgi:hypothetical protein